MNAQERLTLNRIAREYARLIDHDRAMQKQIKRNRGTPRSVDATKPN